MNKKSITLMLAAFLILLTCACEKKDVPETSQETEKVIEATKVKETQEIATQEPTPAETDVTPSAVHKDMEYVMNLISDGKMIYMETTEDMNGNQGSSFGDIQEKKLGDGGYEFTFVPNVNEHMPLITRLDEYDGALPLGGQAVFIRFKTSTAGIYLSFLGDNDFGVYFGSEGEPLVFTYTESNPFTFDGDLMLETDKWYNLFMAMESDGTFNCIIFLDEESDNPSAAIVELGETQSGIGYQNQSWQFEIATHEEGTVTVEHFDIYTYSEFKQK